MSDAFTLLAKQAVACARQTGKSLYDRLRALSPAARALAQHGRDLRNAVMPRLNLLSRSAPTPVAASRVLVDGMWYNPHYWFRYAMLRRALGLAQAVETGLLGPYGRSQQRHCFDLMGITRRVDYHARVRLGPYRARARKLVAAARVPDDIMQWSLPLDFPAVLLFDGILKRQRRATVDLADPALPDMVAEAMAYIEAADAILAEGGYDLVCLSHALDYTYAGIAWAAIRRNIPVVVLYGDYGTTRFIRMSAPADLCLYPGRPSMAEMEAMVPAQRQLLTETGAEYLNRRLAGATQDVGAIYAYQRRQQSIDRAALARQFGWDESKPIIGVYAANWFDYPHVTGFAYFRDFLDWIQLTMAVASQRTDVNWVFKSHPCDDWYATIRGVRIEDLVRDCDRPHIRSADKGWNGADLIRSLDGIVTCHGTVGLEAASAGKPVMVAHQGWYGHAGFALAATSRAQYEQHLRADWWRGWNGDTAIAQAQLFAGWYFAMPDWHGGYVTPDDSQQDEIFQTLPAFLDANQPAVDREIDELRAWFDAGHPYYHVFKMSRASGFQPMAR